jgi:hypothetical protein
LVSSAAEALNAISANAASAAAIMRIIWLPLMFWRRDNPGARRGLSKARA